MFVMKIKRTTAVLVTFAAMLMAASSAMASTSPTDPYQWGTPGNSAPLTAGPGGGMYALTNLNQSGHNYLVSNHRTFGVDLDFSDGARVAGGLRNWSFFRQNGASGPIQPGEVLAMYNNFRHNYLGYGHEHWGMNLDTFSTPRYQWQVTVQNGRVALYNTYQHDYVISGREPLAIDLNWLRSVQQQMPQTQFATHSTTVFLRAQPVVSGFVPYLGSFGGGVGPAGQTLQTVTNPSNNVGLSFVRPGHSTTECGDPSALIYLGPGQTMSAANMAAEWGTATPMLGVTFLACAASNQSLSQVPLNITWYGLS
jgi:hypothetical protein